MPKVAILRSKTVYTGYGDDVLIPQSITEWEEITEDELRKLRGGINLINDNTQEEILVLLEFPEQRSLIGNTIKAYKQEIERVEKEQEKYLADKKLAAERTRKLKEAKAEAKRIKAFSTKALSQEEKKKLLETLKAELGENI